MKKLSSLLIIIIILTSLFTESCNRNRTAKVADISIPFDSALIAQFVHSYPSISEYQDDLVAFYRNNEFHYIWLDRKGVVEYGHSLYSKFKEIEEEGISTPFPYQEKIDGVFLDEIKNTLNTNDTELMLTSLYLFYSTKVYKGIENKTTTDIEWLLPRKTVSYAGLLDSFISDEQMQSADTMILFSQYYKLRDALKRYRGIERLGGWNQVERDPEIKGYKPGDTARAIWQIRQRLFTTGDIPQNNGCNQYDAELIAGVMKFQMRHGFHTDSMISTEQIHEMNIPVGERIKTIVVNMERCRWLSPEMFAASEYIFVNIPSYNIKMYRADSIVFDSHVVVGASLTKTVIFGGKMSYIVFSPYWNLPKNIVESEVLPGLEKDDNYLEARNMEWNNGMVRQKPGKSNSLGLVKFMFPNSNEIYLHDTPSKQLFKKEERAFSHGCVRVENARKLAYVILQNDENWTLQRIDSAMNAGEESAYSLKNKIPVHIGYFTAWVDDTGQVHFYKDVYARDDRLATLLYYNE